MQVLPAPFVQGAQTDERILAFDRLVVQPFVQHARLIAHSVLVEHGLVGVFNAGLPFVFFTYLDPQVHIAALCRDVSPSRAQRHPPIQRLSATHSLPPHTQHCSAPEPLDLYNNTLVVQMQGSIANKTRQRLTRAFPLRVI